MFYRLKKTLPARRLRRIQRKAFELPQLLTPRADGVTVLSMLCARDVEMFAVALASFARHCTVSRVCILNDGSLEARHRQALDKRIPAIEWLNIEDYRHNRLPRGGCWERLHAQVELARHSYVVQLDADTLTLSALDEVEAAHRSNKPFILGTEKGRAIGAAREAAQWAQRQMEAGVTHVQMLAESALTRMDEDGNLRYVRGCAGFSGLPPGRVSLESLYAWSERFQQALGDRWSEWGTEQFMVNFLIANLESAEVLPYARYPTCPERVGPEHAFVHFAGYCRYRDGAYRDLSRSLINQLKAEWAGDPPLEEGV
ncbi:hypothetical protein [Acidihalobacter ferrooxydans]|uniref:Uncharacterized protein n=1 Tax=Acidihalobacter ferrooxydans TaxID=1765967 RepID=A0A1P8UI18_9GAMM|nr:hypothetical protein [Acidihalobacter ferrooxydans]APZ43467.1 hypothetical protein BW247_10515 [Acidihalobacter ferrooxydans]